MSSQIASFVIKMSRARRLVIKSTFPYVCEDFFFFSESGLNLFAKFLTPGDPRGTH